MEAVTFTVLFTTAPGTDGIHALRATLKFALRRGLRCVDAREHRTRVSRCSTAQAARTTRGRRESEAKMKMTKYAGASFVGLDDVQDGPIRGTIAAVDHGSFDRPVITFSNGMKFSCNKTNVGILIEEWGDESEDYLGEKLELYAGTTKFKGEDQPSVLVRPLPRAPGEKKVLPPKPKDSGTGGDMDDEIPFEGRPR
jgi:hypothetical protein